MTDPNDREELLRLREENLRLREERLDKSSGATSPLPPPTTVNVKQVNEGCMAGCGSLIGLFVILAFVLKACGVRVALFFINRREYMNIGFGKYHPLAYVLFAGMLLAEPSLASAEGLTGAGVEVRLGYERLEEIGNPDGVTYGVKVGYQAPVGKIMLVGFDVGIESSTTEAFGLKKDFDLSATMKLGARLSEKSMIYAMGGYSRLRIKNFGSIDGWKAGVGSQFLVCPIPM